jgi:hypothetical protein
LRLDSGAWLEVDVEGAKLDRPLGDSLGSILVLTPKFGKESDLWVQLGEKSVRWKEGFFRCVRQKKSAVGYLLPLGKGTIELILRDCAVTWLKQRGRMDG